MPANSIFQPCGMNTPKITSWEGTDAVLAPPTIARMRRRLGVFALAALLVTTCGGDSHKTPPTPSASASAAAAASTSSAAPTTPGFVPEPISWRDCGRNLRCATVRVPLDYTNPTGATIDVAVNEVPARQPSQRISALLVNPGGPGGSGLEFVASGLDLPGTIFDRFDIVGFDPR